MKKYITCAIAAFFALTTLSFAAPDKDAIMTKEKAAWRAFKDKKPDDFKKLVSPGLVAVYADGMFDLQKELDNMAKTDIKSFTLSDFNITVADADTVVVTYKAKMEATTQGKDLSGTYNCASIWQMKSGEWHGIFHTDMKEEAPAAAK